MWRCDNGIPARTPSQELSEEPDSPLPSPYPILQGDVSGINLVWQSKMFCCFRLLECTGQQFLSRVK